MGGYLRLLLALWNTPAAGARSVGVSSELARRFRHAQRAGDCCSLVPVFMLQSTCNPVTLPLLFDPNHLKPRRRFMQLPSDEPKFFGLDYVLRSSKVL